MPIDSEMYHYLKQQIKEMDKQLEAFDLREAELSSEQDKVKTSRKKVKKLKAKLEEYANEDIAAYEQDHGLKPGS